MCKASHPPTLSRRRTTPARALIAATGLAVLTAHAVDPALRTGADGFVSIEYLADATFNYPETGIRYKMCDTVLLNFGLNGNITEHWSVGFDLGFGITDFEPSRPVIPGEFDQDYLRGEGMLFRLRLLADFNLLKGPVTPFAQGGLGMLLIVSEDEDEDWEWDEGYDYYGSGWWYNSGWYAPTDTECGFLLEAGGGIRWDVSDGFYLKLGGRAEWAFFPDADVVFIPVGYLQAGFKL